MIPISLSLLISLGFFSWASGFILIYYDITSKIILSYISVMLIATDIVKHKKYFDNYR